MSSLCVLSNIPFDKKLLPPVGYKKDNFTQRIEFNSKGKVVLISQAGDSDKGKVSVAIPYLPLNYNPMVGNFKGQDITMQYPKSKQSKVDDYFAHIDWMIGLGIKELVAVKKTLMSDEFINLLKENEPDPKKPGETKYLVFIDGKILTDHPLIKEHWASRRLSLLEPTSGICSLTGEYSDNLIKLFPSGLERPQRMSSDCKIASFDKSYTWLQGLSKKDTKCPVDFYTSERFLATGQWFLDYTGPGEPARRIQLDADTHLIIFSAGDSLALFNANDLVSSFTESNTESDDESDDDSDGELIDLGRIGKDLDHQNTLAYWRSPIDGTEVKPGDSLVYGLTCKFKKGRFCITDAWQGIPEQVEMNYQKFIDSQKATGECFFYGQKRDILPIKSLAEVIEPHGVKSQVARIVEKMFRAALYGDKLPLTWLGKVISRYAMDGKLDTKKRESHQEWKLKLINVILENHNMNDKESGAYKLGMALAGMAIGQGTEECRTMVWKNFSIILQNPSAVIPNMIVRFNTIYAKDASQKCRDLIKSIDYLPTSLTVEEQGQLIVGYHAGVQYIYSKKESDTAVASETETPESSEQLNLLGE